MCWSGSLARCVPGGERGASVYWRELEIPRELVRVREPKRVVLCTFNVYDGYISEAHVHVTHRLRTLTTLSAASPSCASPSSPFSASCWPRVSSSSSRASALSGLLSAPPRPTRPKSCCLPPPTAVAAATKWAMARAVAAMARPDLASAPFLAPTTPAPPPPPLWRAVPKTVVQPTPARARPPRSLSRRSHGRGREVGAPTAERGRAPTCVQPTEGQGGAVSPQGRRRRPPPSQPTRRRRRGWERALQRQPTKFLSQCHPRRRRR